MTSYYIQNLCTNPSFEIDLTGYLPLQGASLQQSDVALFGMSSMSVVTPGLNTGEGFVGPQVVVPYVTTGSISLSLFGAEGNLLVSAATSPSPDGGSLLSTIPVTLSGNEWQTVALNNLNVLEGQELYVIVQTSSVQAISFWVDGVQYEPSSPAHPYIDGSLPFCGWTGTPQASSSFQQFQYPVGSVGGMFVDGRIAFLSSGSATTGSVGTLQLTGSVSGVAAVQPIAAFDDFAIYLPTDTDPALSLVSWNNAGTSTGQTGYNRIYGLFSGSRHNSGSGSTVWDKSSYGAVGFDFTAVPANQVEELTDVQLEIMPYVYGTAPVPGAYTSPRQLRPLIKPTRLNYCPNPSIETSTANWYAIQAASIAQDNSVACQGTYSLKATVNENGDGCGITISNLIVGDTYIVSAWTQGSAGLFDVTMSIAGETASSAVQGTPYGGGTFGGGTFGGIPGSESDITVGKWFQPVQVFMATQSTLQLVFQALVDTATVSYPASFWVDAVLLEEGETLGTYFDGGFGTDYFWEAGGSAGLARSYYYNRSQVTGDIGISGNGGVIAQVLSQHIPLGITYASPLYTNPPTQ